MYGWYLGPGLSYDVEKSQGIRMGRVSESGEDGSTV